MSLEMESGASHSSIYVAPLQINKGQSQEPSNTSSHSRHSSSKSGTKRRLQKQTKIVASMSADEPTEILGAGSDQSGAAFHTYIRAFYPYHPTCDETSSTVTLPLNQGDVILVHSVHTNGWADGTLLVSGARGWLPTNYCEAYDHEPIRTLMRALTSFWDLVRGNQNERLAILNNQDYKRGFIAGVRVLLDETNCLNRESANVQSHPGLGRYRKALLAELASLFKLHERLQNTSGHDLETRSEESDLDEMVLKAFKMVMRGVKFLDIWREEVSLEESIDASIAAVTGLHEDTPALDSPHAGSSAAVCPDRKLSRRTAKLRSSTISQKITANNEITGDNAQEANIRPRLSRASQSYVRPGSSQPAQQLSRPISAQVRAQSPSRPTSNVAPSPQNKNSTLATEHLNASHDAFLGFLSSFLNLHIDSCSSTELLIITQQALESCRVLLAVVDAVWDRDLHRSDLLEEARDNMYVRIQELVQSARDVFQSPREDELLHPGEKRRLEDAATACVRGAGESVAKTRYVIEKIGDFEFEPFGLTVASFEDTDIKPTTEQSRNVSEPNQDVDAIQITDIPPQPSNSPPPPPKAPDAPNNHSKSASGSATDLLESPILPPLRTSMQSMLPPLPRLTSPLLPHDDYSPSQASFSSCGDTPQSGTNHFRTESKDDSSTGSASTHIGSMRDSETSVVSLTSTRATSPDMLSSQPFRVPSSGDSFGGNNSTVNEECEEVEAKILERTFAHELLCNKDGQITGGTLPALIERLTTHDSTPDALFVSTFYLTFRLFASPITFAQTLIDRFEYVENSSSAAGPVRLRVYNVFKGWMESHWRNDCDKPALELILPFATNQLSAALPSAGKRLTDLADRVSITDGPLVPRLMSSIGKTNTSVAQYVAPDAPLPPAIITKSQLTSLSNWKHGGGTVGILDFDPLELARQVTIKASRIFCSILPEELLATEWMKKSNSMAMNVRASSTLSTDLTNLVEDSILDYEDVRKRAKVVKQWVKIANKCLELNNYDSLMAIHCALNSSTITRLKKTWDLVSSKTKVTLEHLRSILEVSKNHAVLRQRLQNHVPPCLPFLGTYLTDLTFVDAGNQTTRQLPGVGDEQCTSVINFDKHMKTAKIISELQRFQHPYRLTEVPELQTWIQVQLVRVRSSGQSNMQNYYRRSLLLEPREHSIEGKMSSTNASMPRSTTKEVRERHEILGLGFSL